MSALKDHLKEADPVSWRKLRRLVREYRKIHPRPNGSDGNPTPNGAGLKARAQHYVKRETPLAIYPLPADGKKVDETPIAQLKRGDKVHLPLDAVVIPRFPKRKPKKKKGTLR